MDLQDLVHLQAEFPRQIPSGVPGVQWDRVYGTNLYQVGPNMAKLDLLGQVGRHFAVFCLLGKAPLSNLDQVGPALFPAVFRALLIRPPPPPPAPTHHGNATFNAVTYPREWTPLHTRPKASGGTGPPDGPGGGAGSGAGDQSNPSGSPHPGGGAAGSNGSGGAQAPRGGYPRTQHLQCPGSQQHPMSMAPASSLQQPPASSSAAFTIPVKPAPAPKNASMVCAPKNAPFPNVKGADPWTETWNKKQHQ